MKKLLVLLLIISKIHSNSISWLGSYDKALEIAKKEHKPIMVLLVKKNSNRCNEIIVKYLMNHKYINKLNSKYISVIITFEGRLSYPIELFYSNIFPTLFFIDSKTENFLYPPLYDKEIKNLGLIQRFK